ncbi:DoxX-like family protein [Acinetobacter sp. ANC 4636]
MNPKLQLQNTQRLIQYSLAALWIYQGLIPKVLFQSAGEIQIWQSIGFEPTLAKICVALSGLVEILFGATFLLWHTSRIVHRLNIVGLAGLLLLITMTDPSQLSSAFNPVIMNSAMIILSIVALQLLDLNQTLT